MVGIGVSLDELELALRDPSPGLTNMYLVHLTKRMLIIAEHLHRNGPKKYGREIYFIRRNLHACEANVAGWNDQRVRFRLQMPLARHWEEFARGLNSLYRINDIPTAWQEALLPTQFAIALASRHLGACDA